MANDSNKFSEAGRWPDARCKAAWEAHCRDEWALEVTIEHSKVLSGAWRARHLHYLRARMQEAVRRLDEDALAEVLAEALEISEEREWWTPS